MGHKSRRSGQLSFIYTPSKHRYCHGGNLRNCRSGRGARPLSTKQSLHTVFKLNKTRLRSKSLRVGPGFGLSLAIIRTYAKRFFVKIDQLSIQNDHIHLLIRTGRRSRYHYFFRVVAGQIAQRFEQEGLLAAAARLATAAGAAATDTPPRGLSLWKWRPFSRVVSGGRKAYFTVKNYIQLNEKEARGEIRYRATRLKGLSMKDWEILWS